nr:MAG TPA: hypothetical protein [Caudoviricetes sp.]
MPRPFSMERISAMILFVPSHEFSIHNREEFLCRKVT